jgi:hypothetical protein
VEDETIKSFLSGIPWEEFDDIKEGTPSGRLAFFFQIRSGDTLRLMSLLKETKVRNFWGNIFGEAAFTVQMIPTKQEGKDTSLATKRGSYVEMVQMYGSV